MRVMEIIGVLIFFAILAIFPIFLSTYYIGLMILMLIYGIFAMSANILMGFAGLPSLGHAAYFGVAAYISGYLALKGLGNFWLVAAAGMAVSSCVAAILSPLALRTRGVYYMMVTLAISQVLWGIAYKWTSVTHGDDGLSGITRPDLVFIHLDLSNITVYYYFTLIFFMVAVASISLLVRSPFGLVVKGTRDSETRMSALGYNTWLYLYLASIIAGFFASIAGVLHVYYQCFVGPGDLQVMMSAKVLLMAIFGGVGTLVGPIVGAFSIVLFENFISGYTNRWLLILGLIYVLVILFAPQGIYPPIKSEIQRALRRTKRTSHCR